MSIENRYDPDERRLEAMMDGSGFSRDRAEIKLGQKIVAGTTETPRVTSPERKLHPTGHVRDFESDRDHQLAEERAAYEPLPENQAEINLRGRAMVEAARNEAAGEDHRVKALKDEVEQRIPDDPDNKAQTLAERDRLFRSLWYARYGEPYAS